MDTTVLYETLYHLVSENVEDELFGTSAPLAYEAFQRSAAGNVIPCVWFEIPLSGPSRFDLHVAYDNAELHGEAPFAANAADGHGALLNWYASEPREGGGLALAYDAGDGRIDDPAVHVNVRDAGAFDAEGFFTHVGRPDAIALYDGFTRRLPQGWRVWYYGVHPGRPGAPIRVDCFVDGDMKQAYAAEPSKLGDDLCRAGVEAVGRQALCVGAVIAASPFGLELQFDVMSDGEAGQTVGLSASFPLVSASKARPLWESGGEAARLMRFAEELEIADSRWRRIGEALFTTAILGDDDKLALYCVPTFVKYRVREGVPLDAKVYLQAGARRL